MFFITFLLMTFLFKPSADYYLFNAYLSKAGLIWLNFFSFSYTRMSCLASSKHSLPHHQSGYTTRSMEVLLGLGTTMWGLSTWYRWLTTTFGSTIGGKLFCTFSLFSIEPSLQALGAFCRMSPTCTAWGSLITMLCEFKVSSAFYGWIALRFGKIWGLEGSCRRVFMVSLCFKC